MNIVLFGFMGSGKSTVAKILSETLKMKAVEMDSLIEQGTGMSISNIFSKKGEPWFRTFEREVVKKLCMRDNIIISTGGGVVLNQDNIKDLKVNGITISLMVSPEKVIERTESTNHRPLLEVNDKLLKIRELLDQRKDLYKLAEHTIDTNELSPKEISKKILQMVRDDLQKKSNSSK